MEKFLIGYQCKKCGHLHYPLRMVCKKCRKNEPHEFDPVPLPKKGTLLTYTCVHNLPADFEVAYLFLGIVELTNGIRVTAQLKIPEPKIGMKVKGEIETVRREEFNEHLGMVFYPE